jgi:hypothetical protein
MKWLDFLGWKTAVGAGIVATGLPLADSTQDWTFWIDIIVKVLALILAALAGKKAGAAQK